MADITERLRALSRFEHDDKSIGEEAASLIERLTTWLQGDATCPCCEQVRECADGCTFVIDDVHGYERMAEVRKLLED